MKIKKIDESISSVTTYLKENELYLNDNTNILDFQKESNLFFELKEYEKSRFDYFGDNTFLMIENMKKKKFDLYSVGNGELNHILVN